MIVVSGESADEAYSALLKMTLSSNTGLSDSRLGPARDLGLVTVLLRGGGCALVTAASRALNPFLAIAEASWVLAGRRDVKTLAEVVDKYRSFSDDGSTLYGAYGYRLRHQYGIDQLHEAVDRLKADKLSRRVFLTIGHADDLTAESRDIPCNVGIMFRVREQKLDMTVINRSNDLYLGVPYDWFVFSVIHAFVGAKAHIEVGNQVHVSNSLHLYAKDFSAAEMINSEAAINFADSQECYKLTSAILENFEHIADSAYARISCPRLKNYFMAFSEFKRTRDKTILEQAFEADLLGKMAKNWAGANALT